MTIVGRGERLQAAAGGRQIPRTAVSRGVIKKAVRTVGLVCCVVPMNASLGGEVIPEGQSRIEGVVLAAEIGKRSERRAVAGRLFQGNGTTDRLVAVPARPIPPGNEVNGCCI
jgi:hypothetical protein